MAHLFCRHHELPRFCWKVIWLRQHSPTNTTTRKKTELAWTVSRLTIFEHPKSWPVCSNTAAVSCLRRPAVASQCDLPKRPSPLVESVGSADAGPHRRHSPWPAPQKRSKRVCIAYHRKLHETHHGAPLTFQHQTYLQNSWDINGMNYIGMKRPWWSSTLQHIDFNSTLYDESQ